MNGFVFYDGKSLIDDGPVVGIATGLKSASVNVKTGGMVQVYFLRPDIHPLEATKIGADASICGTCRHRGKIIDVDGEKKNVERSCYVTLFQGPSVVYRTYKSGKYKSVSITEASRLLAGRNVRLSAYGDPGCLPVPILTELVRHSRSHTGYSHLWRTYPELRDLVMASCDSESDRKEAKALGFRTFRVRSPDEAVLKGEGQCPASKEMGKVTTCNDCLLCDGLRRSLSVDVTLLSHGIGAGHFNRSRVSA